MFQLQELRENFNPDMNVKVHRILLFNFKCFLFLIFFHVCGVGVGGGGGGYDHPCTCEHYTVLKNLNFLRWNYICDCLIYGRLMSVVDLLPLR